MKPEDWPQVKSIYESGLLTGIATFEEKAPEWVTWDSSHLHFGRLVAEHVNKLAGWVALSKVSDRCIYQGVAEVSIYIHPDYRGQGIGKKLMQLLIEESEKNGIWTLQSGIFAENIGSIALHTSAGFRQIGYREKIGCKNGVWKDTVLMERRSKIIGYEGQQ